MSEYPPHSNRSAAFGFEYTTPGPIGFEYIDPYNVAVVDANQPLHSEGAFKITAELKMGDTALLILDFRDSFTRDGLKQPFGPQGLRVKEDVGFMLIDETFNPYARAKDATGFKTIKSGEQFKLGRKEFPGRLDFTHDGYISRLHADIFCHPAGFFVIKDRFSKNGTGLMAADWQELTMDEYHDLDLNSFGAERRRRARTQEPGEQKQKQETPREEEFGSTPESELPWLARVALRRQEIAGLEPEVRAIFEKPHPRYPNLTAITIPWELTVNDAAELARNILAQLKTGELPPNLIYRKLMKEYHPDNTQDPANRERKELMIKLIGELYDTHEKKFKF